MIEIFFGFLENSGVLTTEACHLLLIDSINLTSRSSYGGYNSRCTVVTTTQTLPCRNGNKVCNGASQTDRGKHKLCPPISGHAQGVLVVRILQQKSSHLMTCVDFGWILVGEAKGVEKKDDQRWGKCVTVNFVSVYFCESPRCEYSITIVVSTVVSIFF